MKLCEVEIQACFHVLLRHFLCVLEFFQNSLVFVRLHKPARLCTSEREVGNVGLPAGDFLSRQEGVSGDVGWCHSNARQDDLYFSVLE